MNNLNICTFSDFPENVLYSIFSFLTENEILDIGNLSKSLRKFITTILDWGIFISTRNTQNPIFHNFKINKNESYLFFSVLIKSFNKGKIPPFLNNVFSSKTSEKIKLLPIIASSTDYDQTIHDVLNDDPHKFWSSLGSENVQKNEYLIFEFENLSILQSLIIRFYYSSYSESSYPSEFINLELGMSCDKFDFKSKNFQRPPNSNEFEINLNLNFMVSRFIKVNFINKVSVQDTDNRYYIAVEKITVFGVQINSHEISKIDNDNNNLSPDLKKTFRYGLENYYENSALIYSDNKKDLMKFLDHKHDTLIDKNIRDEYFKERFVELLEKDNLKELFTMKDKYPEILKRKWFFDILLKKTNFIEYYFDELVERKTKFYLDLPELEAFFSYYFFVKNKQLIINLIERKNEYLGEFRKFHLIFESLFSIFHSSLSYYYCVIVSNEFFKQLIKKFCLILIEMISAKKPNYLNEKIKFIENLSKPDFLFDSENEEVESKF